jgi:predicted dehydrogenase
MPGSPPARAWSRLASRTRRGTDEYVSDARKDARTRGQRSEMKKWDGHKRYDRLATGVKACTEVSSAGHTSEEAFFMSTQRSIAVIGAGYWGPNLVRNFRNNPEWDLVAVCDLDEARARKVIGNRSTVDVESSVARLFSRTDIDAVAIATPAHTHAPLALAAFEAGKHVLVEKPLAANAAHAADMVEAAERASRVLMIDHTYCYTPAVAYIGEAVASGTLGEILYVDSVRINLGLVQPDVDVFWDLAPHDLSILDFILPGGLDPVTITATGSDPLGAGKACVGYLSMPLAAGGIAHVTVNWLSPTKIRQMVIGGSKRTLVWDDLNPQQRVSIHDRGVDLGIQAADAAQQRAAAAVSYRMGDIVVPALPEREALSSMATEFAAAINEERPPLTDGPAGLRVLSVLEAVSTSLGTGESIRPELPKVRELVR